MIGAIAGDVIGSAYEKAPPMEKDFLLFSECSKVTDDTVMTVAVASAIRESEDFAVALRKWGRRYPQVGYGGRFKEWLFDDAAPAYNSFGNGSAMRVAPVGWAYDDLDTVLREAARSAEVTHDHPEGIKGAQAIAGAVLLARKGEGKNAVAAFLSQRFAYDLDTDLATMHCRGGFDITCQGTVPKAAVSFLESTDFEDAVRNAVSLGGDADTNACITGALAEAHYGAVPQTIQAEAFRRLDSRLRGEVATFAETHGIPLRIDLP